MGKSRTGLVWHERFMWLEHGVYAGILPADFPLQPGQHHENAETKRRLKNLLDVSGLVDELVPIRPRPAGDEDLLLVHEPEYLARLARMDREQGGEAGFDAPFTRGGFEIARLAAGGCVMAAEAIMAGSVDNAYCLMRPVSHHAEPGRGMGFCLLSSIGIAGHVLLERHGVERIAYVDFDVHHGNGVEKIFWRDPRALTISVHQDRWFPPDSGGVDANGEGPGEGYNINVPLPAGSGWGAYEDAFARVVLPALDRYRPQFLFIPAGFDAGAQDPLGRMILSSSHFRRMTQSLLDMARRHAGGRVLVTHEGGYNESTVAFAGLAVIEALCGRASGIADPYAGIFDGMPGHELLVHQRQAVDDAARLVERVGRP